MNILFKFKFYLYVFKPTNYGNDKFSSTFAIFWLLLICFFFKNYFFYFPDYPTFCSHWTPILQVQNLIQYSLAVSQKGKKFSFRVEIKFSSTQQSFPKTITWKFLINYWDFSCIAKTTSYKACNPVDSKSQHGTDF